MNRKIQALRWIRGELCILDQRKLPGNIVWIHARNAETVAHAIQSLAVRGAPVIGIAAAYGVALAARRNPSASYIKRVIDRLACTRPTGRNLFSALDEISQMLARNDNDLAKRLERKAVEIHRRDAQSCLKIARYGNTLMKKGERILTYCNTGALATGGIGTALGVIKLGYRRGRVSEVFACETRPMAQGARLTVWECVQERIPVTLICDNMAAALIADKKVDRVLVGADRIARNGDTSNKIGTLSLALAAKQYRIPFHVVAPTTTFDLSLSSGKAIQIEERDPGEILRSVPGLDGVKGLQVKNPSFDVTPARFIRSFVTDYGILHPPFSF